MNKMLLGIAVSALGVTAIDGTLRAAEPAVQRVVIVQPTDPKAYAHEIGVAQDMIRKAGLDVRVRVWQATFAGTQSGAVAVTLEFASMLDVARYQELTRSNAEYAAELAKIVSMRKLVSDSLYQELDR